ncbi:MAG: hypothetical protein Q8T04_15605, partial [Bacteroidota bacterium]|nr:hypothetical protein [Bacteroidota bacterium]
MNSNPNRSIVVISASDIVLAGLAEILKGSLAGEVIVLHRGDEIIDYQQLNGSILVIGTAHEFEKSGTFIRQILSSAGTVQFRPFHLEANSAHSNQSINLYDAPALI